MTLRQRRGQFHKMLMDLLVYAGEQNIPIKLGEAFRPFWVALQYFKDKVGILNSLHCRALAIDIFITNEDGTAVLWTDERYKLLADYWVKLGGTAGYYWKKRDMVHFEVGGMV